MKFESIFHFIIFLVLYINVCKSPHVHTKTLFLAARWRIYRQTEQQFACNFRSVSYLIAIHRTKGLEMYCCHTRAKTIQERLKLPILKFKSSNFFDWIVLALKLTPKKYQKLRHSIGCSFPLKNGDFNWVTAVGLLSFPASFSDAIIK